MNKKHHLIISVFALLAMVGLLTACGGNGGGGGAAAPIGVNIDFGAIKGFPAATYPAAASQAGEWNNIVDIAGVEQPLNDLSGAASSLKISVTSEDATGSTGNDITDDNKLLNDNFYSSSGATWTVLMTGIPSGDYSLYIYGPSHSSVPTGDMTINGAAVASIAGGATLVLGTSYTVVPVTISNGTLTMSGVNAVSFAGLAGLQLVPLKAYVLTGVPTPDSVFNSIDQTYKFNNNLVNSIWQRETNIIVTGDYSLSGYWSFAPMATYPTTPDNGTGIHSRMVQIPATNTVIYNSAAGVGSGGPVNQLMVATISTTTGLLSSDQLAVFSDGFTGNCQVTSSSANEFLCYDGTDIRRYLTAAGSSTLTANGTLTLSTALPAAAECNVGSGCWGTTFAFDGAFYYFASAQNSNTNLEYIVYDTNGTLVNSYTATGSGAINGVYFDWSVGRYSTHDGFGNRVGVSVYGTGGDSHNFGPISTAHTLQ